MQVVCPWFEPETSKFDTFTACCMEFTRRKQGKKTYQRSLKLMDREKRTKEVNVMDLPSVECEKTSISEISEILKNTTSSKTTYTSKYGIKLNLTGCKPWSAPDVQKVISLPQFFATIICHRCTQYVLGTLLLQYKNEPEPRVYELPDSQDYEMLHSGNHLFVYLIQDDVKVLGWPNYYDSLYYVGKQELHKVMDLRMTRHPVAIYNGLFHYFFNQHFSVQASLDGADVITDKCANRTEISDVKYCGKTGYSVVSIGYQRVKHLWNMSRDTLSPLKSAFPHVISDIPLYFNVPYPGIDSVDLQMALDQEEEPIEPVVVPFALFSKLFHLSRVTEGCIEYQ